MNLRSLITCLFGSRQAIQEVASSRNALWLGLLFVISAGFAREYDGESLLHEPWHVLIPLGASLLSSFLLYGLVFGVGRFRGVEDVPFLSGYRTILTLFWMTAPLAWLYALPVERFLNVTGAVRFNLTLLAVVSLWRVALMSRIVSVLFQCHIVAAFFVVMLYSDALAMFILYLTPLPIFDIMGGIRLTESEELILNTSLIVGLFGYLSLPIWFVGTIIVAGMRFSKLNRPWNWSAVLSPDGRVSWGLWTIGMMSIGVWLAILPLTQAEQQHRWRVERDLTNGRIEAAIHYMSERRRDEFPRHWDPPPRIGYGEGKPPLEEVLGVVLDNEDVAPWVSSIYVDKVAVQSGGYPYPGRPLPIRIDGMNNNLLARYVELLERLPEGRNLAQIHSREIKEKLREDESKQGNSQQSDIRRKLLLRLNRLSEKKDNQIDAPEYDTDTANGGDKGDES